MGHYERANGRQLGQGMRPGRHGKALRGKLFPQINEHVVARMVAQGHQKGAKQNLALGPAREAAGQVARRVHEHVGTTALRKGFLKPGERLLARGATVAGKRDHKPRAGGQRLVEVGGHGGEVLLFGEQGRGEVQPVKAPERGAHGKSGLTLEPAVRHVRRHHEGPADAARPQLRQGLGDRGPHGTSARPGTQAHVGRHGARELADQRGHARVGLLAGEAAGYDQAEGHGA